jgi:plastocyanin
MRTNPLLAMAVAAIAALALMVAPGCGGGDDADDAGEAVESVATSPADEGLSPGTTGTTPAPDTGGTAPPADTTGGGTPPAGGAEVLEIPADETDLAFQVEEASAAAGTVTLRMPNPSAVPHNIAVDEPEKQLGEVVQQGGVSEITVDFPAGEYEYYCSVPGHREAGMVGTLTVE